MQLNPFDLVVLLTLSNTMQNAIIGEDNSVTGGVIGATSLLIVNYLVVRFLYGHKRLDQLVERDGDVLIDDGKVRLDRLKKELINFLQLGAAARKQGFESLDEVQKCVLEPGGTLTFAGKKPATDDIRHQELVTRLERLMEEVALLRRALPPANAWGLLLMHQEASGREHDACPTDKDPSDPKSTTLGEQGDGANYQADFH